MSEETISNPEEPQRRIRKSGLRKEKETLTESIDEFYTEMEKEHSICEFETEYRKMLKNKKLAYIVYFKNCPTEFFIAFQPCKKRDTGRYQACKYFQAIGHPVIGVNHESYYRSTDRRIPAFDRYADSGRVPVWELLRLGVAYHCARCNKGPFFYEDYKNNKCFAIEDEGNLNPFTKGIIVCPECKRIYYS